MFNLLLDTVSVQRLFVDDPKDQGFNKAPTRVMSWMAVVTRARFLFTHLIVYSKDFSSRFVAMNKKTAVYSVRPPIQPRNICMVPCCKTTYLRESTE